jgi:hypothetical protein
MTVAQSLADLDATWSEAIVPDLRAAVRQLHSWTGGFKASASGAAPDTVRREARDTPDDPHNEPDGPLVPVDAAQRKLRRIHTLMARTVIEHAHLAYIAGTEYIPPPPRRFEAEMAWVQLSIHRLRQGPLNRTPTVKKSVKHLCVMADELAKVLASAQPANVPAKYTSVCHAHEVGGMHAYIDAHYTREHLCRWCGDFRRMHGVNPPTRLIKLHDRGIRITNTHLRNNGIRIA